MEHPDLWGFRDWRPLARGAHAVVWEARQLSLNRLVAVKVYQREVGDRNHRRVLREAAATGRLSGHPGIITTYDAGSLPDGRPYLVMELCPGGSLARWVEPDNRLGEDRVRRVGVLIAEALAEVHAGGLLHRDVRPASILIDGYGRPRLGNFGQAADVAGREPPNDALTLSPGYAPPEAFAMQPATEFGDVFSLGATLYALLAGRPARAIDATATLEQMVEVASRPIRPLAGIDPDLMDIVMAALSGDPAARPTAASFSDQLANEASPQVVAKRALPLDDPDDAASVFGAESAAESRDSAMSSPRTVVTAVAADAQRAPRRMASAAPRRRRKSRVWPLAVGVALLAVITSATAWLISRPTSSGVSAPPAQSVATAGELPSSAGPSPAGPASEGVATIQLKPPVNSAKPFEAVRISGMQAGGADTLLQVQRLEGGKWVAFPVPTKTDHSGRFTTFVELGERGRYWLRVLDPDSGQTSKPFVLEIKG